MTPKNTTEGHVRTVEVERSVIDSADLSYIGLKDVGEVAIELVGEPDRTGTLPERVTVRGELEVFVPDADE